jgi:oligoendopeptidase F
MRRFAVLFAGVLLGATPAYHLDLSRYFSSAAAEAAGRSAVVAMSQRFLRSGSARIHGARDLLAWLDSYDALLESLERHEIYLYVRSEENVNDHADANASDELATLEGLVQAHVDDVIASMGAAKIQFYLSSHTPLLRYRYFLESTLARSSHRPSAAEARVISVAVNPAIDAIGDSYKALRRVTIAQSAADAKTEDPLAAFRAKWSGFAARETAFAAMFVSIASMRNGTARLRGFDDAAAAAYFDRGLSSASVDRALEAVRTSDAYRRYHDVVLRQAAKRLKRSLGAMRPWDAQAADNYEPPRIPVSKAITLILAAEREMGPTYAAAYRNLLDPARHRFEVCDSASCDDTGFSVGFAGIASGLFLGDYDESVNRARALAHEAGHAVHREFMREHQPTAVYNVGPNWMFESFAIFNELLFYDYLYKNAAPPQERAYYLNRFLDDATFQVFGSAQETDLEASLYRAVASGSARSASDFDRTTLRVFEKYDPLVAEEPEIRDYWARDELYFTDPLYDVNYLYAGLLALRYFELFEADRGSFEKHYVALLQNGFDDTPATLLRRFLGIDVTSEAALVRAATAFIDRRTAILSSLYADERE